MYACMCVREKESELHHYFQKNKEREREREAVLAGKRRVQAVINNLLRLEHFLVSYLHFN